MTAQRDVAPRPDRLPPAGSGARPAEGWLTLGFVVLMSWRSPGRSTTRPGSWASRVAADFLPWAHGHRGRHRLRRRQGRLGALAAHLVGRRSSRRCSCPIIVGWRSSSPDGGTPGELYRATATVVVAASGSTWRSAPAVHHADGPLPPRLGRARLGRRAARRLHGVRPSPAARRGDRRRAPAARQHGADAPRPAAASWSSSAPPRCFLLIRTHVFEEEMTGSAGGSATRPPSAALYLRGGAVVHHGAVLGSLVLTTSRLVGAAAGRCGGPRPAA